MTTIGAAPDEDEITRLFDASPDRTVRASAASVAAFITGLVALVTTPFTMARGVGVVSGLLTLVLVVVGMAATSRSHVAGRALVAAALFSALAALVMIGMGYAGFDTTFGDGFTPTLVSWLDALRSWLRLP